MRYLYYIAGIVIIISGVIVYAIMDPKVEISKPAIVVNDRVISESEFEDRLKDKPYYMNRSEYADSVITEQLLIQEAVRQDINKEESFRRSVEQYYEKSLIKILLDRKLNSFNVSVTDQELDRYKTLASSRLLVSKFGFASVNQALKGPFNTPQTIDTQFQDLSGDLQFLLLNLEPGKRSKPVEAGMGVLVYRLDKITPLPASQVEPIDEVQVKTFILDQKKERLMDDWTRQLKAKAEIWRKK